MVFEKELEKQLITQLSSQGYEVVEIKDEEDLVYNFRKQLEKFKGKKLPLIQWIHLAHYRKWKDTYIF